MKSVKRLFFAFFTVLTGFVLMATVSKVEASAAPFTPWTLSFDNGQVKNVNAATNGFSVLSNGFSITYNDTSGKSDGGIFDIWKECLGVVPYEPVVYEQYIANGQTFTYQLGGYIWLRAHHYEYDNRIEDTDFYSFFVDRSINSQNRFSTNLEEGKYFYNNSISIFDNDFKYYEGDNLVFKIKNLTTGAYFEDFRVFLEENGKYEVTVCDVIKNQTKIFTFSIDKTAPIIQLYEWNWMVETQKLSGDITSYGMKVVYGDNIQVNSMTYEYRPLKGRIEFGTMPNEQIFWRKGHYTITVTDMSGNQSVSTFTITDYDLIVDPVGATVGTEVTMNNGAYLDTTMHVGYTRCIYLGANANSQSRFDFNFTSSDESIATVSAYGTVTAHGAGTVVITSVNKGNGQIGKIILTVLPK